MSALTIRPCGPLPWMRGEIEPGLLRPCAAPAGWRRCARRDRRRCRRGVAGLRRRRRLGGAGRLGPAPARRLRPWPRPSGLAAAAAAAPSSALASSPSSSSRAIGSLTFTPSVPSRDQDLAERALVDRLDLHGRLVGLDLGDDVAGLTVSPSFLSHGEVALGHGRRQRRHQDLDRHDARSRPSCGSRRP